MEAFQRGQMTASVLFRIYFADVAPGRSGWGGCSMRIFSAGLDVPEDIAR
jgi:hypothetical protein